MPDQVTLGEWSSPFSLENVAIHAHLLPNGKVLYWGRRKEVGSSDFSTLNDHATLAYVWDPATGVSTPTANQPVLADGSSVNLFCSGHAFLADGRLMVIGGHLFDSQGVNQSCTYDFSSNTWTVEAVMNEGRWYPSALTLPDGGIMALSGSFPTGPLQPPNNDNAVNPVPQVWRGSGWQSMTDFDSLTLFPRFHVAPNGQVFMSGGLQKSYFFDITADGNWIEGPNRAAGLRDYAPSVMYDAGKVAFIGGGLDSGTQAPTNIVEIIDLNAAAPAWQQTGSMQFSRRQHNATLLPDGSILVTGGTQGDGFNDLDIGAPIRAAEQWNPSTGKFTTLAEEAVDRCYHSTAILLPDGRVLSAGGGEYAPSLGIANPVKDTHADAQLFSPPYLFTAGDRPEITNIPDEVKYGESFDIEIASSQDIKGVSWIRLGSVTHSFDQNQRLNFLNFVKSAGKLTATAPGNANICPPGHYTLFVLNAAGKPSIGKIVRIIAAPVAAAMSPFAARETPFNIIKPGPLQKDLEMMRRNRRPPVTVGITPTCPYGISACWGGARDALQRLSGVAESRHVANSYDSTAELYLMSDTLPDLDVWRNEFAAIVNGLYTLRGLEMSLKGRIVNRNDTLTLERSSGGPSVALTTLKPEDKVQWDFASRQPWPLTAAETEAYANLLSELEAAPDSTFSVTGPLVKGADGFQLEIRASKLTD